MLFTESLNQVAGEELKKDLVDKQALLGEAAHAIQALEQKYIHQVGCCCVVLITMVDFQVLSHFKLSKWPNKSTTGYDMLDYKSYIKNCAYRLN